VLTLTAYLDESGTHAGSEAIAMAGYMSTTQLWAGFEGEWAKALKAYGLDRFHMTDFAVGAGPYRTWGRQKSEYRFKKLVEIVNAHILASIGIVVPMKLYETVFSAKAKRVCGGPYGLAASLIMIDAPKVLKKGSTDIQIAYVFEAGARGAGQVLKRFQENLKDPDNRKHFKLLSLRFEDKRRFLPLQAADILAYELYKHLPRTLGLDQRAPRVAHLMLLASAPFRWGYVNEAELRKLSMVMSAAPEGDSTR